MNKRQLMEELSELLENNGEIRISSDTEDIFIESVDDKEGASYISNSNDEFSSSREAIEWAVDQFSNVDEIIDWE